MQHLMDKFTLLENKEIKRKSSCVMVLFCNSKTELSQNSSNVRSNLQMKFHRDLACFQCVRLPIIGCVHMG